jgi:hypothetical protein
MARLGAEAGEKIMKIITQAKLVIMAIVERRINSRLPNR